MNCRKQCHAIVSVLSFKVNWTVAKSNGTATISENQFLVKIFGRTDCLYFFPGSNACDNSSPIIQEDVDVIFDFINDYNCENDKDDSVFIDYCDYVFRELIYLYVMILILRKLSFYAYWKWWCSFV